MKKLLLLCVMVLLSACSEPEENKSVAQILPSKEKETPPTYNSQVEIYTLNGVTTGFVIAEEERSKWILTNASNVSNHPNVLIHEELMLFGEVQGIDVQHNMAIIHMRNSHDFNVMKLVDTPVVGGINADTNEMQYFTTVAADGEPIQAPKDIIEILLKETMDKPIKWQERFKKNAQLQTAEIESSKNSITNLYDKNIFTYNPDQLKNFAMTFITQLNAGIEAHNLTSLEPFVASDDVLINLEYVKKPIKKFKVKEAKKEGVYYFVNGIDEEKNEVRLTIIKQQQQFQVIGTNLIEKSKIEDEKTPVITLQKEAIEEQRPALHLFLQKHLPAIKLKSPSDQTVFYLKHQDKKISVNIEGEEGTKEPFYCEELVANDAQKKVQIIGCTGGKQDQYVWDYE
ncbi:hypothetical protein CSE16_09380 [Solibacillus sp. R5-41]|uniref:hypothetical protein n=1 Tax=Solibacillus sp. R5-41 TaxID=2048654 RepID=UPI000C126761|nr:hypothetical protein [Solibacillus sp. R5-41]ATP40237.1 hypothetical protein CSE16_09380 [Solibacillus sp. R5-41]